MSVGKQIFDLVVIGSGPAGQRSALQGAKAGKKVAIIEEYKTVGGGCVHVGTLPSKSFRESVYRYSLGSQGILGQEAEHYAAVTPKKKELPEIERLLKRCERVVHGEEQVIQNQLTRNGITIFQGRAKLISTNDIEIKSDTGTVLLTASFIFIAAGARPVAPEHLTVDGKTVVDSNSVLQLKKLPKTMVVLGAGIIGCEYASMFSMAGTQVYLVDRRHEILASVDREIVNHLTERFNHQGMEILLQTEAVKLEKTHVVLSNGRKIETEVVLIAQGRFGNTENMGLEALGIQRDQRGLIKVDPHFRTSVPNIYAVGDVIGAPALASTSMEQGRIACCHAFQIKDSWGGQDYVMPTIYPYGIYTIPEISILGQTEEALIAEKVDFVAGKARYRELARGQIVGDRWGLLKLMVDRKSLKILGVHIVGDNAADLIHIGQAVMSFGGDVRYFIRSVFNYPTLAEAYKTAAFHAVNQIQGTTKTK